MTVWKSSPPSTGAWGLLSTVEVLIKSGAVEAILQGTVRGTKSGTGLDSRRYGLRYFARAVNRDTFFAMLEGSGGVVWCTYGGVGYQRCPSGCGTG